MNIELELNGPFFLAYNQGWPRWRITRHNTPPNRGEHFRFHNTDYTEGPLFRAAFGFEARASGEGFVWDKVDQCWWVSVHNAARYVTSPDGQELEITEGLLEEVVREALSGGDDESVDVVRPDDERAASD